MKKYLITVLILLLVSLTGGCMLGEDVSVEDLIRLIQQVLESDEEGEVTSFITEEGVEGFISDNYQEITSVFDIIDKYSSFEFQYSQTHPKKRFNKICKLNNLGPENIDGIFVDKIRVEINSYYSYEDRGQQQDLELEHNHVYEVWVVQDGDHFERVQQIARDGIMLADGIEMSLAAGNINNTMVSPFSFDLFNNLLVLYSKPHFENAGWQLVNRASITREIGNGAIEIDALDFLTAEDERKYFELATVNGNNIVIGYYTELEVATMNGNNEGGLRQFQINKLVVR